MKRTKLSAPSSAQVTKAIMMGLIFLLVAVGLAIWLLFADKSTSYTNTVQRVVYSIGLSGLLSALITVWLAQVMRSPLEKPKERGPWFYPMLSGGLALCAMSLAYIFLGVWPIGDKSVMIVDMHHQYAPLLAELRDMLLHGGSPLYSFEVGLGASFLPLFGYYLASPFNLLLVLFPESLLTEGILVITLLKNALSAAFFAACVQYVYRKRDFCIPIVAVMYSLMMYLLAYSWNIMWLDCVMVLPLVILGFEKLMRTGNYLLYVLSLAYALYANYYIGFMLCLFLVLYFIAYILRKGRPAPRQGRSFARFAIGSALAGGLAMFLLIPVALALGQTSAAGGSFPEELKINFPMFDLLGRHLYGASPTIRSGNLPNLYCGILAVFLLPIFATTKTISLRRRLSYLGLWAVMGLSLVISQLDLVWHGLHSPNDLPYRFSFLYSFVLLLIAYEALLHIREISLKQIGGAVLGIFVYILLEERFGKEGAYTVYALYVSLALVGVYALITALTAHKKILQRTAYALLLVIVVGEMTIQAGDTYRTLNSNEYFTAHKDYVDNEKTAAIRAAIAKAQAYGDAHANGEFYRLELLPRRTCVDTSLFHYRGMTVFASSNSYKATKFMGSLGYAINGVNSHLYHSFVAPVDSLLGIRYVTIGDVNMSSHPQLKKVDSVRLGESDFYIYENTKALPVAFAVRPEIRDWSASQWNPFMSQNTLFSAMTGNEEDLYTFSDIVVRDGDDGISSVTGLYNFSINPGDTTGTGSFETTITEKKQGFIYVDCRAAESISVELWRDGSTVASNTWSVTPHEPYIIDAGTFQPGDTVRVDVTVKSSAIGNIYVASLNNDTFEKDMDTLSAGGLQVTSFSDSRISGTIHADEASSVFVSIPYDKGWTVKVDGQPVETYGIGETDLDDPSNGAMLGFDILAGDHTVELSFMPRGLWLGVGISLISLVLLILLVWATRRRNPPPAEDLQPLAPGPTAPSGETAVLLSSVGSLSGTDTLPVEESPEESAAPPPISVSEETKDRAEPSSFSTETAVSFSTGSMDPVENDRLDSPAGFASPDPTPTTVPASPASDSTDSTDA